MMWLCASMKEALRDCKHYGFSVGGGTQFSWAQMKEVRDRAITRLIGLYQNNLAGSGVTTYGDNAKFLVREIGKPIKLQVGTNVVTADHVLVATGGHPTPLNLPGSELCINSDGFFTLEEQPKKVAVIGGGYIAVELASVFTILGTETHLFTRWSMALRRFDEMVATELQKEMTRQGCHMHPNSIPAAVVKDASTGTLTFCTRTGDSFTGFDAVLVAIGRTPNTQHLGLDQFTELQCTREGFVVADDYQNTSVRNIYALGDVCGKVELTPMAIAAGRRLADRLFGGLSDARADYENVPTVIFAHPPIGCIGMTERDAKEKYGEKNIRVYRSSAVNMHYTAFNVPSEEKPKIRMKLVCLIPKNDKIIGMHIIGMGADEMLQGFGVAMKMGATKSDLDCCVAIHPTAAEEMVTIPPWGLRAS